MMGNEEFAQVVVKAGTDEFAFRIFNNPLCQEIISGILEGRTYPRLGFVTDVRIIVDIGANVGAASLFFAINFPTADILAFEPSPDTYKLLSENLAAFPKIQTYELGLSDRDCEVPLFLGKEDAVTNSIGRSYLNSSESVSVNLKDARSFLTGRGVDRIDILKIDTEGCELPILRSLIGLIPQTKVIYLEYHDEEDRLAIDQLLRDTHILYSAKLRHPHRGEVCYVAYSAFPSREAVDNLRIKGASLSATAPQAEIATQAIRTVPASNLQGLCDAAVVIPSVLRPSLKAAVESVFQQKGLSSIHVLLGVDKAGGDRRIIDELVDSCPDHCLLTVVDFGYSTSVRHGGLYAAKDGGSLRTILSYAANSRYVAYLDDDNWWAEDHLLSLLKAIRGHDWAYSLRWFVDADTMRPVCVDTWESAGPDAGIFSERFGGFVDPNTLMIDKIACEPVLRWWCFPLNGDPKAMSADRNVFHQLRTHYHGNSTHLATCLYRMDPQDGLHPLRLKNIQKATSSK
jgi:FkbM family methyltransferase